MRITLVHKSDAGSGEHSIREILRALHAAGHDVEESARDEDWGEHLVDECDMVLIAGGDGTVASVVRRLIGSDVPFAILPLGMANNIATELGWTGPVEEIIPTLGQTRSVPFSIGVARGPWGVRHFLEGVGVGPFTSAISFAKSQKRGLLRPPADRAGKLRRDLQLVQAFVNEGRPVGWKLDLDGETCDGDYLLLEVMNTGRVGPNLELAPEADLGDDLLDVVLVGETERLALTEYLQRRQEGPCPAPPLPVRKARRVRMIGEAARVHIDDDVWPKASKPPPAIGTSFEIDIQLEERPVTALVPNVAIMTEVG